MRANQGAVLLFSIGALAAADFPAPGTTITFYRDAGCASDASSEAQYAALLPSVDDACISGTTSLKWPTSMDAPSVQVAYFTGDGLPESCDLAILQQADIQPDTCGTAIDVINGGTTGSCKQGKLPVQSGLAICCGGSGKGCAEVPSAKRSVATATNSTLRRGAPKDVTEVKRTPPFQRLNKRDCSFQKTNGPYQSRGNQQITTAKVDCPGGSGAAACSFTESTSITTGSTNTFGVSDSITAGTDLFVDIQDTVSFSYMYSYSESKSSSQAYTITVPAGETGYVTWTPTVSCVDGTFSGTCSWQTSEGTGCIPMYVDGSSGALQGEFGFLQEE